jgi:hypothetical protein
MTQSVIEMKEKAAPSVKICLMDGDLSCRDQYSSHDKKSCVSVPKLEPPPVTLIRHHETNGGGREGAGVRTGPPADPDLGLDKPSDISHLPGRDAGITLRRRRTSSRSRPARESKPTGLSAASSAGSRACLPIIPCTSSTVLAAETRA